MRIIHNNYIFGMNYVLKHWTFTYRRIRKHRIILKNFSFISPAPGRPARRGATRGALTSKYQFTNLLVTSMQNIIRLPMYCAWARGCALGSRLEPVRTPRPAACRMPHAACSMPAPASLVRPPRTLNQLHRPNFINLINL